MHACRSTLEDPTPEWTAGELLPVRVVLRKFAEQHAAGPADPTPGDLWSFIGQDLQNQGWGDAVSAMRVVQTLAFKHGALVLLDGLDECGDEARRRRVLAAVHAFMLNESAGPRSRFIMTARPYAFPKGADETQGVYPLAGLDEAQIGQFIERWYVAVQKHRWTLRDTPERMQHDLVDACRRPDLQPLASNPLLLTLMAVLHSNLGRLPDDRVDLYRHSVDLLLQRWNSASGAEQSLLRLLNVPGLSLEHFHDTLAELAFDAHQASEGREGLADIPQSRLLRAFKPLVGDSFDKASAVVEFIERRAGLLQGQGELDGEPRFRFPHRTFQEFLAARHLQGQEDLADRCSRLAGRYAGHWLEVLPLAARLAGPNRGATAADEVVGACDPPAGGFDAALWDRVHLAGRMLCELGPHRLRSRHQQGVTERVRRWLTASLPLHPSQGGAAALLRAAMGTLLSLLGDPRFDPGRHHLPAHDPMLGFVRVPARPAEAMARYPVTVAQYRSHLNALGREPGDAQTLDGHDNET